MAKPTHEERIAKALAAKAAAEAKLKRLAELEAKAKTDRLLRLANKTNLLDIDDEVLMPELRALVTRLLAQAKTGEVAP